MPNYASELVAAVEHDYRYSNLTLAQIAAKYGISSRDVNRMRELGGWPKRSDRMRRVPQLTQVLQETEALAAQQADPSPALRAPPAGEGEERVAFTIERIGRLVERELAAEEAARARLGTAARDPADAQRCARTLSILTQILHTLARLRGGAAPEQGLPDDDDMPADIDEFRRDLARRIDAFVASRTDAGDADRVAAAGVVDEVR